MTYIVGVNLKKHNISFIVSDIMATLKYADGSVIRQNTALKTGLLFPGCLFGLSGVVEAGQDFLLKAKSLFIKEDTVGSNFDRLANFIKFGNYDRDNDFKIIFSVRNPNPELYYFDSRGRKLLHCGDTVVSIGSGKEDLDSLTYQIHEAIDQHILKLLEEKHIPMVYYPCFYCLGLSERTLGFEGTKLNELGVGGLFHYCYQTSTAEHRPKPLVYVISTYDPYTQRVSNKVYRISFARAFLVLDYITEGKRSVFVNNVERPDLKGYQIMNDSELLNLIYSESDSQPFYYFCGFATHYPNHRGFYTHHISSGDVKVVDKSGHIRKDFVDKITTNIKEIIGGTPQPLPSAIIY